MRGDPRSIPLRQARRLVAAGGQYVDDIRLEGCLHAVFVRSPFAHAGVLGVNAAPALELAGVRGVYSLVDLERLGARRLPVGWVVPGQRGTENDLLARDRVRYVGDPVAVVVAKDAYVAEDAAWLVEVAYDEVPAVADVDQALAASSILLHPEWGENVLARVTVGSGDTDAAFAGAAHVVGDRFRIGRSAGMPIEPRGAIARIDEFTDEVVLVTSTQSAHHARMDLAETLGRPESSIRVIAPDVGGAFGVKDHLSPEEAVLCLLALDLREPVKWIEDRHEHLTSCVHSREQVYDVELAADAGGRILGLRGRLLFDAGAYSGNHGMGTALYAASMLPGPYAFSDYRLDVVGVVTNKAPSAAYRGYGGPEAAFVMEGLVDAAARSAGLDPAEVRRRNFIPLDAFPYRNPAGLVYDQADHEHAFERALALAGYEDFRSAQAQGEGTRKGVGIASIVQRGGFGPSRVAVEAGMRFGGYETALVRMDGSGRAFVFTGMSTQGQGIDTALAQVCAERLGLDPERDVTVICGDTHVTPFSPVGAIASRGAAVGGAAVYRAAGMLAEKLKRAAGLILEGSPDDIELRDDLARVRGAPERHVPLSTVAASVQRGEGVPEGTDPGLEAVATFDPAEETTSYATHVAFVEVEPATGRISVGRYVTVTDCGTIINPSIVEGQVAGAVVQGIGGALMEELVYAEDGTFLTPTLAEYHLPTSADVPTVEVELVETPTPETPTGARGAGEIGITGPAAAIANAVADALSPAGRPPRQIPLTPERVWSLSAQGASPDPAESV